MIVSAQKHSGMIAKLLALFCALSCACVAQTTPNSKPPVSAPKDAKLFNWKWYAVFADKVSWQTARDKCVRMGGQLAVIPDKATWDFVKTLTKTRVWLGATDEKLEGEWVWVDGTKMTFTAWTPGNPDNAHGKEHYLYFLQERGWNDTGKEWDFYKAGPIVGYICEWQAR
jgi:hypothetical protein